MLIDNWSYILGRFISDGIEIEQSSSITSAEIGGYLSESKYKNAFVLLKYLQLKITKISGSMIEGDTLHINDRSSILGRFISDGMVLKLNNLHQ